MVIGELPMVLRLVCPPLRCVKTKQDKTWFYETSQDKLRQGLAQNMDMCFEFSYSLGRFADAAI